MKRLLLTAAGLMFAVSAHAAHCPKDMKAIDAALAKNPKLSAEQMAEVKKLRAEGEADHKAGRHKDSLDKLEKAMGILGVKH